MKIEDRLQFTYQYSGQQICLFNEGVFARAYNESAYIITSLLGYSFKLSYCTVQKLQDTPIIYCRFPQSKLDQYFADCIKTDWGFMIKGQFILTEYENWFKQATQIALQNEPMVNSDTKSLPPVATTQVAATSGRSIIELTPAQEQFLRNWQRGIFSSHVEQDFIASLQQQRQLKC